MSRAQRRSKPLHRSTEWKASASPGSSILQFVAAMAIWSCFCTRRADSKTNPGRSRGESLAYGGSRNLAFGAPDAVIAAAHHDVLRVVAAVRVAVGFLAHAAIAILIAVIAVVVRAAVEVVVLVIAFVVRLIVGILVVRLPVIGVVRALDLLVAGAARRG